MKTKIIILARECDSTSIVYNYLKDFFEIEAVVFEKPIPRSRQFSKRARRLGYINAISQVIFFLLIAPVIRLFSGKRKQEIYREYHLDETSPPAHLVHRIRYINTEEGRNLLIRLSPTLIIVNGTRIISKKTLESVPSTFINIHTGITPLFRGVHGGYWSVAKDRKDLFGTTIHYVDPGVDTGQIIDQVFTRPTKKDNFYTYPYLQYAVSLPALKKVVEGFLREEPPAAKPPVVQESALWFHPTVFQWFRNIGRTFLVVLTVSVPPIYF